MKCLAKWTRGIAGRKPRMARIDSDETRCTPGPAHNTHFCIAGVWHGRRDLSEAPCDIWMPVPEAEISLERSRHRSSHEGVPTAWPKGQEEQSTQMSSHELIRSACNVFCIRILWPKGIFGFASAYLLRRSICSSGPSDEKNTIVVHMSYCT